MKNAARYFSGLAVEAGERIGGESERKREEKGGGLVWREGGSDKK